MNKYFELKEVFSDLIKEWSVGDLSTFSSQKWIGKHELDISQMDIMEFQGVRMGILRNYDLTEELSWAEENQKAFANTENKEEQEYLLHEKNDRREIDDFLTGKKSGDFFLHELEWLEKQCLAYMNADSQKTRTLTLQRADKRLNYIASKFGISFRIAEREKVISMSSQKGDVIKDNRSPFKLHDISSLKKADDPKLP